MTVYTNCQVDYNSITKSRYDENTYMKTFKPKTKQSLQREIKRAIKEHGNTVDLSYIDVSLITDMSELFIYSNFNGNVSNWDVSNVKDMSHMFCVAILFNSDISNWDVSNVKDMSNMFNSTIEFNGDISDWDVSNVKDMSDMFYKANSFNQDISGWNVSNVKDMSRMFCHAKSFNSDISNWDVSNVAHNISTVFCNSKLEDKAKLWFPEMFI